MNKLTMPPMRIIVVFLVSVLIWVLSSLCKESIKYNLKIELLNLQIEETKLNIEKLNLELGK